MGGRRAVEAFVLVEDFQCFGEHGFGALVELLECARDSPAEVDSGRSCLRDSFGRGPEVASFAGREHNAKRPRRAERRGATDGQAADRVDQLVDGAQTENAVVDRQRGLVNDRDRVAVPVDGPAHEPTLAPWAGTVVAEGTSTTRRLVLRSTRPRRRSSHSQTQEASTRRLTYRLSAPTREPEAMIRRWHGHC